MTKVTDTNETRGALSSTELGAEEVIRLLDLAPHPEGGYFKETFRDEVQGQSRGRKTAIYFLLTRGQVSHWHRVDAAEMWHYYAGDPLLLSTAPQSTAPQSGGPRASVTERVLGPDLRGGQRPQLLVETGHWQSARSQGAWTLVGCTVSPAFEFAGFVLAPPDFRP